MIEMLAMLAILLAADRQIVFPASGSSAQPSSASQPSETAGLDGTAAFPAGGDAVSNGSRHQDSFAGSAWSPSSAPAVRAPAHGESLSSSHGVADAPQTVASPPYSVGRPPEVAGLDPSLAGHHAGSWWQPVLPPTTSPFTGQVPGAAPAWNWY
ncbi:MAG: hypothetical protein D6753_11540 [Planctomycetota bacterium]|nr:MAG: hypothetical protein D6753_11540 [Planctomycetota bacterium]